MFFNLPSYDVGFWYKNLSSSLEELKQYEAREASQLEKTNALMKLRETLLDTTDDGTSVTAPAGISVFPYNKSAFAMGFSIVLFLIVSIGNFLYLNK